MNFDDRSVERRSQPDPNVTPYRPDLAASHLRGTVEAERYAEGVRRQALRGIVPLRRGPGDSAPQLTELLYGETFTAYEEKDGWLWGQCDADGYVGYVRADGTAAEPVEPTHRVRALRCFLYPEPDFKISPLKALSVGARLAVVERSGAYARIAPEGWVHETAIEPLDAVAPDYVETAHRFLGVPYLWGGRSSLGIDCSGLVQVSLAMAGVNAPRDSYMQQAAVGDLVDPSGAAPLRRGDIVFFPGHVGLMADSEKLVHATAHTMCVTVEPVADVAARTLKSDGSGIIAVRRFGGR
ncbi:MAG TPA: NlpC/P60 family protein [Alphaproteobacteria bacterium]|nr:NlpC/P60 family protein [Alphaproteobacteria bacterium]